MNSTLPGLRNSLTFRRCGFFAVLVALLLVALCPGRLAAADTVIISEFVASNVGGLVDEDLDSSDWLELYNFGNGAVNLSGWFLTDNTNNLTKWAFPATTI